MASLNLNALPSLKRQNLLTEFAGLKQACPEGIFLSLIPGESSLWSGVIFVREGPYSSAILRFQISFPDLYPSLPPLVTFSTDIFHPLITPLTTYMYSTDIQDNGTVSASDDERLPPGGFSLRHGFPDWFGRRSSTHGRISSGNQPTSSSAAAAMMTPPRQVPEGAGSQHRSRSGAGRSVTTPDTLGGAGSFASSPQPPSFTQTRKREVSTYAVLAYMRSVFSNADVLDSVLLEAAGNPGAWHAWRSHRQKTKTAGKSARAAAAGPLRPADEESMPATTTESSDPSKNSNESSSASALPEASKRPGEWNWDGVWEERVRRGIAASLSEPVIFGNAVGGGGGAGGAGDDLIKFTPLEPKAGEEIRARLMNSLQTDA